MATKASKDHVGEQAGLWLSGKAQENLLRGSNRWLEYWREVRDQPGEDLGKEKGLQVRRTIWEKESKMLSKQLCGNWSLELFEEEEITLQIQEPDHRRALDVKTENVGLCCEKERE